MKTTATLITTTMTTLFALAPAFAQSATTNQPWSGTLVDSNSPLLAGSDLGKPAATYQQPAKFWNDDPVSQAFEAGTNAAVATGKNIIQHFQPQTTPAANLSTPEGRFAFYQPILQRRAEELNRAQASQQTQYTAPAATGNPQQSTQK